MQRISRSVVLPLVLVLVVAGAVTAALALGSSTKDKLPGNAARQKAANFKPADIAHDVPKLAAS